MQVIDNELSIFIDIDDTILMWDSPTEPGIDKVEIEYADELLYLTPHYYHISLIKKYKQRGYTIFMWSANGFDHALKAVEALGLNDHVDFVLSKPTKHMDDSDNPGSILGPRVYVEDFLKPTFISLIDEEFA